MYRGKAEQAAVVEAKFEQTVKEQEKVIEKHLKLSQIYKKILLENIDQQLSTLNVQTRMAMDGKMLKSFVARRYSDVSNFNNNITVRSFRLERAMEQLEEYKSPPMYIAQGGFYKFCIGARVRDMCGQKQLLEISLKSIMGYFDDVLGWPTPKVKITVALIDRCERTKVYYSGDWSWDRPTEKEHLIGVMTNGIFGCSFRFNGGDFLKDGTLCFMVYTVQAVH